MKDLPISMELFSEILRSIQSGLKTQHTFNSALNKVCDGHPVITLGKEYLDSLIKLLGVCVGDTSSYSIIEWWLFENVEKYLILPKGHPNNEYDKELKVIVETPEQLYIYFTDYN